MRGGVETDARAKPGRPPGGVASERLSILVVAAPAQRRALGTLFLVLALMLAGVASAAADAARREPGLAVIAFAAGALAVWLGLLAFRALRNPPS